MFNSNLLKRRTVALNSTLNAKGVLVDVINAYCTINFFSFLLLLSPNIIYFFALLHATIFEALCVEWRNLTPTVDIFI